MRLSPSAHTDSFCRDRLPPADQWPRLVFDLPELHYPGRLNAATALLDETAARLGPDRPCLRSPHETWTYGDVLARANRIAHVLTAELGIVPGNRVLLRGTNAPWLAACWLGVLKAGAVAVTTMPMLRRGELDKIIDRARPTVALCDERLLAELPPTLPVVPYRTASDSTGSGSTGGAGLAERCARHPATFADVPTAADDVALLAFTSGTTGTPKATMHFHRDLLAIADTFSRHVLRPTPDDLFCGTPPLAFTFGLGGLLVFPLHVGASVLLLERATPQELASIVAEQAVTVLFTAPTAYRAILGSGDGPLLTGVRRAVSAGEALPAAVAERYREVVGSPLIDGIGSTEMLHVFISAAGDDARPGRTGKVVPGFRAAVLDADGRPAPDGTPGLLAVQGPTGCRYLGDPRQADYVRDGWNITGDTYVREPDGYFRFVARSDDMIVSSGYNIAAPEVEEVLLTHPDVEECAVVGTPDPDRGAVVTAFVVLRPGVAPGPDVVHALQEHAKAVAAPYKYPRRVRFLDALPRNAGGKLQRYLLRER
ncbi:acetyl-CoA synthetase [Amycolatopsis mediterranei S699]|uniref:Acetyl-CoA synthetase n=4 Tax=Amycolatopsis mediterranei TaxID=33910 RepID=A0A0H3D4I1_AMYMU|nr:AMP-binding protein [Amycolatopsis mediterranei]ADJ45146.1 acetyl-CoA synthetase [Amycolatopsis mediterranei U32]AEK41905.1 acetyl-CoA synthetase [Amycolatopsis mediterranei S699]AFO76857.1 acetyl-CoA synthetase [Amycolatopsis mediterranei S699]AGT83985.1 acetyl-CoA synthetase [Amycolatopsis mediterranei RB]KDO08620.1 2-aminobenzoate-CoA ligase [Amycolatopsis mediterranei]